MVNWQTGKWQSRLSVAAALTDDIDDYDNDDPCDNVDDNADDNMTMMTSQ